MSSPGRDLNLKQHILIDLVHQGPYFVNASWVYLQAVLCFTLSGEGKRARATWYRKIQLRSPQESG